MQETLNKKLVRNGFLLSVIFHLVLLLFLVKISTIFTIKPDENNKKSPQLYIPSYVYKGAITPAVQQPITHNTSTPLNQEIKTKSNSPIIQKTKSKLAIMPSQQNSLIVKKADPYQQGSILDMSRQFIKTKQVDSAISHLNNSEPPMLLIGDKNAIVDPLAKLVGRSLSAHFRYPRIQGTFGARGRVYIELVLHPEGYFSDVQIVQSSEIEDFNAAALYAVNTAPTVVGVDKFLPKAKRFVVGFIFE